MNKQKNGRKQAAILTALLSGALLITGTLAWQDVSQHKTNKFTTTSVEHNVVLMEDFEEVANWRKGQEIVKAVSVRNGQETDTPESYIYDDAYIRVQFKEYMEIGNQTYTYNDQRLMVNDKGNFERFETVEKAQEFLAILGEETPSDARIVEIKGYFDDKEYAYIATQQADKNGQYGKFLVIDATQDDAESIVEGKVNQSHASDDQHQEPINDEDQYTVHEWSETGLGNAKEDSPFLAYVKWKMGADVITLDSWDGQPTAKWILDTTSTQGWAYWGEALVHGTDISENPESVTSKILESVTLVEQPHGAAEYYIHVNMDAVSKNDLPLWDDAPEKVTNALTGKDPISLAYKGLQEIIDASIATDYDTIPTVASTVLAEAITAAESVRDTENVSLEALKSATTTLQVARETYNMDSVVLAKRQMLKLINEAKAVDPEGKTEESLTALSIDLANGEMCFNHTEANIDDVTEAMADLKTSLDAIKAQIG
ncbi:hypothetical protein G7062_03205 [Erysipelothrix sp. HDW6C]|uniref:hypothetical protein n=1 Tax=Erysipelothrix sp. HDW6C TaxID=2714930 RepID=UPI00140DFEFB|nr:hypothetical protein [Erysipelothrix sp. HDW6C]QIK69362.1 hypothetical protein G7062_03205 [Erysipelothrix sp. HDW6C]